MRYLACCILAAALTPAQAAKREDPKLVAARDASVALVVPPLCPELKLDHEALEAFMARARLREGDLAGVFRTATQAAVARFQEAAGRDPAKACSDVQGRLGDDGPGLLVPRNAE